jgi:radical SAM superfamily enzyme YgiQ (UPF0313 family)
MKILFLSMDPKGAVIRGAGYVAASIPNGNELKFYCCTNSDRKNNYTTLVAFVSKYNPDIIMVSTTTLLYNEASTVIKRIKKSINIPVLMGGVHPTTVGSDVLKKNTDLDYLCIGEGETFIKDFVNNYGTEKLFDINNLAYRRDDKVFSNPLNPVEDLTKLPMFPYKWFRRVVIPKSKTLYASVSRGCPYSCTYCANSTFLKMYGKGYIRQIPLDYVMKELEYLKHNYDFKQIHFGDDTILANSKYAIQLLTRLKSELNISYTCMSRAESINEEMVSVLKKTGCISVGMGVECGDEAFRKKYLKRFMTNIQLKDAFKLLQKSGIQTTSYNMIGWPFDNDDELTKSTEALNKELNPNIVQVTWFYPFPGTQLYDYCEKHNLINKELFLRSYHIGSILKGYENKKSTFKSHIRK